MGKNFKNKVVSAFQATSLEIGGALADFGAGACGALAVVHGLYEAAPLEGIAGGALAVLANFSWDRSSTKVFKRMKEASGEFDAGKSFDLAEEKARFFAELADEIQSPTPARFSVDMGMISTLAACIAPSKAGMFLGLGFALEFGGVVLRSTTERVREPKPSQLVAKTLQL